MRNKSGHKIKLTLFVLSAIALFTAGIYFIGKKQQMFNKTFKISGIFKDISGLRVGNNVRFSGINIGIVEDIKQITDSTVKVDLKINDNAVKLIKKDAKAIIGSDGLMGDKIVIITPGTEGKGRVVENDIIGTAKTINVDDILFKLKVTGDNAADITGNLSVIMKNITEGKGTAGKLFMDSAFAQNIVVALNNLKEGTGSFKRNMDAAGHSFLLRRNLRKNVNEKNRK